MPRRNGIGGHMSSSIFGRIIQSSQRSFFVCFLFLMVYIHKTSGKGTVSQRVKWEFFRVNTPNAQIHCRTVKTSMYNDMLLWTKSYCTVSCKRAFYVLFLFPCVVYFYSDILL